MNKEDQNTEYEYKQGWREEHIKCICGFANAEGGRLVVGVSADKKGNEVTGVEDWKSLLEAIPDMCAMRWG